MDTWSSSLSVINFLLASGFQSFGLAILGYLNLHIHQNMCCINSWKCNSQVKNMSTLNLMGIVKLSSRGSNHYGPPTSNVRGSLANTVLQRKGWIVSHCLHLHSLMRLNIIHIYWLLVFAYFSYFSACWSFPFLFEGTVFIRELNPLIWQAFQFVYCLDYFIGCVFFIQIFMLLHLCIFFLDVSGFGIFLKAFPTPRL